MALRWCVRKLASTRFAERAIAEEADLSVFKQRPTFQLVVGLVLLALSMLLGWPAVAATGVLALLFDDPLLFLVGGPAVYGFSWLVWLGSLYFLGTESYRYGRIFLRWLVRRLVERHGGPGG